MKTKYLDNEIELLNSIKRNHEISDYGQEKLNEFMAIKKQLLLHNVVFSEAELKAKLEEQKEEIRQWLMDEDFEGLAELL